MSTNSPAGVKTTLLERARDECVAELASSVLVQAVMDWKDKCERIHISYKKRPEEFMKALSRRKSALSELRRFFKSGWCSLLCGNSINPKLMLQNLEWYYKVSPLAKQIKQWEAGEL